MATIVEQYAKRVLSGDIAELHYFIDGDSDESVVRALLLSTAPTTFNGLSRDTDACTVRERHDSKWLGIARYAKAEVVVPDPVIGDAVFSFDTTGGTQHVTHSEFEVNRYPTSAAASNGVIGAQRGGSPLGADIVRRAAKFSERYIIDNTDVTSVYRNDIFVLTGVTNADTFRGYSAREVLFLGASGSRRGGPTGPDWEITFHFAYSPNATNITVGTIGVGAKDGWDLLDVRYEETVSGTPVEWTSIPKAAYVHRVYAEGPFENLHIGTGIEGALTF